ncbi:MAG: NAD(P)-binding domain-containing protein [Candidatus Promineifilaceae bacterium]
MNHNVAETNIAIIGAGPIGIELAIALERLGVDYVLIEARQIGHEFSRWPPSTHFFSTPEHVALAGVPVHNIDQMPITGEQYLAYLRTLVEMFDLKLKLYEPVTQIEKNEAGFTIYTKPLTGPNTYRAQNVVLATGGMARPRMLGIPGEELPHVSHYFPGPHPYFRRRVLVVGGRNSAMEAALRCWRAGAQVALSYRREELDHDRIKPHLSMDIQDRLQKGEVTFYPATIPLEITPSYVKLATAHEGVLQNGSTITHECDAVLLCTGFEADMTLFRQAGVTLVGPERAPKFDESTMETDVRGLYVAGTAAGGTQSRFTYFISTSHDHVARIVRALTGEHPGPLGTVAGRNNAVTWDEVKAN